MTTATPEFAPSYTARNRAPRPTTTIPTSTDRVMARRRSEAERKARAIRAAQQMEEALRARACGDPERQLTAEMKSYLTFIRDAETLDSLAMRDRFFSGFVRGAVATGGLSLAAYDRLLKLRDNAFARRAKELSQ